MSLSCYDSGRQKMYLITRFRPMNRRWRLKRLSLWFISRRLWSISLNTARKMKPSNKWTKFFMFFKLLCIRAAKMLSKGLRRSASTNEIHQMTFWVFRISHCPVLTLKRWYRKSLKIWWRLRSRRQSWRRTFTVITFNRSSPDNGTSSQRPATPSWTNPPKLFLRTWQYWSHIQSYYSTCSTAW